MSIRIYDFDFNLLGECAHPISCEWELKYNGIGAFEAEFDARSDFAALFAQNSRLLLESDGLQAVVTGVRLDNRLKVFGRTPEWLLSKRVVLPFKSREIFGESYTDPETIILYLLQNTYKTPHPIGEDGTVDEDAVDEISVCENLIIPEPKGCEKLTRHFWRNAANMLSDVIADLCELMGCGYSLRFDTVQKVWKFAFEFGKRRDLIVSKSLKNAYDMRLTESVLDAAGGGFFERYASGESEDTAYGYIGGSGSGMLKWDRVLGSASGASEAASMLKKYEIVRRVECELTGAAYGTDYTLGDTFRVQTELGSFRRTINVRVDGVSMLKNASSVSVKPAFKAI